jgi:hypothetical protein
MFRSDALPPARNSRHFAVALHFFLLLIVLFSIAWLTGCSAATSANAATQTSTAANHEVSAPHNPPTTTAPHLSGLKLSSTLPAAFVGTAYNAPMSVSGGFAPYFFTLSGGALPAGLSLSASTGTISGTPSAAGTFSFSVTVADPVGGQATAPLQITVSHPGTVVVTISPATATVASAGTEQFSASVSNASSNAVTWSASAGTISSTGLYQAPTVTANTTVTITATSVSNPSVSAHVTITIAAPAASIVTVTPSVTTVVSAGTVQFTASVTNAANNAVTWSASAGTISASGLYRAPSVTASTSATITATSVSNPSVSAHATVTITPLTPVVTVTPATTTVASSGTVQYTASVSNTSNTAVTWSASAGTISSSGLFRAPSVTANTNVTITATSVAVASVHGTATATVTAASHPTLAISTTSLTPAISGTSYSDALVATGGTTPYTWTITAGALPTGITLSTTGLISGTTTTTGTFNFTVKVADSSSPQQTATQAFTLTVNTSVSGPTIASSFFGADFNMTSPWPGTDGLGNPAQLAGIRLWDDGVKWGELETANGTYDWTPLDTWLGLAEGQNYDVLYTFGDTPQWAAASTPPKGCNSPGPYSCAPPTDVNADGTGTDAMWQAFVTALVTHAAGRISYYELWNEPDCSCFWSGTTAQLVRMGADAAAIIRSLDPNAQILSPSAHGPTMATWFDGYIAAGGAANFDIVNVHMRGTNTTNSNPLSFLTVYGEVESELQKRNLTSLPLWDDEHGIVDGQGLTDPDLLAGYAAVSVILRAGVGLQRQYIYTWNSPTAMYGMQGNLSGTAWDQVAGWLIGHSISPCVAGGTNGTVYTCQLDYGQIVWDSSQTCSNGVCTYSNYAYPSKYTSYHDMASPSVFSLSGSTVQIGYQPIVLMTSSNTN